MNAFVPQEVTDTKERNAVGYAPPIYNASWLQWVRPGPSLLVIVRYLRDRAQLESLRRAYSQLLIKQSAKSSSEVFGRLTMGF